MNNNAVFTTRGDWDSTTLTVNEAEVLANRLYVHYQRQIDRRGKLGEGEFTAVVNTQDNPDEETGILPGTLTIDVPNHNIVIKNIDPHFAFEETRFEYQEIDVTESLSEFHLEIDSVKNVVEGYITLWQGPIATDKPFETFTIL